MIAVSTSPTTRRPMLLSSLWLQGVILTFVIGFAILAYLAMRIYQDHAPIPDRVVTESGETLFTGKDILEGQEHFLTYGLMQYGTVYGHGAYLGPDFTADYLHRQAVHMERLYGGDDSARARMRRELRENRYDPETGTLVWSEGQRSAFEVIHRHLSGVLYDRESSGAGGVGPHLISDPDQARQISAFIAWAAWTTTAQRPGQQYSYTNNWPPDDLVGNTLTGEAIVWSALSLITLLGGIGIVLGLYGRFGGYSMGWHESEERRLRFVAPSEVPLTPGQTDHGLVLPDRRRVVRAPERHRCAHGPLSGRAGRLLRHRPASMAALRPDPNLAPPAHHLLRRLGLPGGRHLPGPADRRP